MHEKNATIDFRTAQTERLRSTNFKLRKDSYEFRFLSYPWYVTGVICRELKTKSCFQNLDNLQEIK